MRAVDTNVLVRLLARDDARPVAAAESFVAPGAWVSHLVLMEAVWVLDLVYGVAPGRIANGVELLLDHDTLVVDQPEIVRAALAEFRKNPKVGFSHALILAVARAAGHVPLGTFDRRLGRLDDVRRL